MKNIFISKNLTSMFEKRHHDINYKFKGVISLVLVFIVLVSFNQSILAAEITPYAGRTKSISKTEECTLYCSEIKSDIKIQYEISASYTYDIASGAIISGGTPRLVSCTALEVPTDPNQMYLFTILIQNVRTPDAIVAKDGSSVQFKVIFDVHLEEVYGKIKTNEYNLGTVTCSMNGYAG